MSLLDLPNEVICMIAQYLPNQRSVKSFMGAHRRFNGLSSVVECLYNRTPKGGRKRALLWAAIHGNEDLARAMLRLRGSARCSGEYSHDDPLIRAAAAGHTVIVKMLLEKNPSMIHSERWFNAAVAGAGFRGHIEILNLLLNVSAPVPKRIRDIQPDYGISSLYNNRNALDKALHHGKEETVHILLADDRFALGPRSLDSAASGGNENLVRLCLREAPSRSAYDYALPLCSAARFGNVAIVKLLLEESDEDPKRPERCGQTPLHCAASAPKSSAAIIKLLLARNDVEPDAKDTSKNTSLSVAARHGNLEAMRLLLDTGKVKIEVLDSDRRTPLSHAAGGGYTETVMALLATGGVNPDSMDSNGRTPLSWAAESGYADVAKVLLGTGKVAPDTNDKEGKTPLSWAAKSGFAEVAKILLATGKVAPDTPDMEGKTPLALAAGSSAYTSNINARDISQARAEKEMVVKDIRRVLKGEEPLVSSIEAARRKETPDDLLKHNPLEVMELLLQRDDVNPNSRTKIGQTPLMFAAQNRQIDAVQMLMNTGKMDLKLEDEDGWTALTYAERGYKPYKPTQAEVDEAALDAWEASL